MTSINIDQYYKLADDIQAVKKRDIKPIGG